MVDIKREKMVVDKVMYANEEKILLDNGSKQDYLWEINLYPELPEKDFIEFGSIINIRPRIGNFFRGADNEEVRKKL